ncbi:MAG: DUF2837 family protein [bacterium]|nr:DUF2837 family protein [bacterium]
MMLICGFTFLIHLTESSVYSMRLAGVKTRQVAIALSFITSALLISRLSNMGQAPLLGVMVDQAVELGTQAAVLNLVMSFRLVVFAAFLGTLLGVLFTPTTVRLLGKLIMRFLDNGSLPRTVAMAILPRYWKGLWQCVRLPRFSMLRDISLANLPKQFLIMNVIVTAIYTIGVLCALLAGAMMPDLRATAIQLSGIVNGIATILLATIVDPAGARITDQAIHGGRPQSDVKSVVVFLLLGRLLGTLVLAQLFLMPLTHYIMWVTRHIARFLI